MLRPQLHRKGAWLLHPVGDKPSPIVHISGEVGVVILTLEMAGTFGV